MMKTVKVLVAISFALPVMGFVSCARDSGGAAPTGRIVTAMTYNIRVGLGDENQDWYTLPDGYLGYLPQCARVIREVRPDWVAIEEIDNKSQRTGKVELTKARGTGK